MTVLVARRRIGGLTLALSLHQLGIPVLVHERWTPLAPWVWHQLLPHAVRELCELASRKNSPPSPSRPRARLFLPPRQADLREPRGREAGYRWPQFSIHPARCRCSC